jgi:hypothetical protein
VRALDAPVELGRRLVPAPRLQEPPERLVVPALRAFDFGGWQGVELRFLVPDDLDLVRGRELLFGLLSHSRWGLVGVPAVVAKVGYRNLPGALDLF